MLLLRSPLRRDRYLCCCCACSGAIGSAAIAIGQGVAAAEHGPRGCFSSATYSNLSAVGICSNLSVGLQCRPPARPARSPPHAARLGALLGLRGRNQTVKCLFPLPSLEISSESGRPERARRKVAEPLSSLRPCAGGGCPAAAHPPRRAALQSRSEESDVGQ